MNQKIDNIPKTEFSNLAKMVRSIKIEAEQIASSISKKNLLLYEKAKENCIEEYKNELKIVYQNFNKTLAKKQKVETSKLLSEYRKKNLIAKNKILDIVVEKVKNKLFEKPTNYKIAEITLKKLNINFEEEKDFTLFCRECDFEQLKIYFSGKIKKLPISAIGGLIIAKNDGLLMCDNSFKTRLETLLETNINLITEQLFKIK